MNLKYQTASPDQVLDARRAMEYYNRLITSGWRPIFGPYGIEDKLEGFKKEVEIRI